MNKKICSKCGKIKLLSEFHISLKSKDGHRGECKKCRKLDTQKYLKEYDKDIKLRKKKYRIKFPWKHTLMSIKQRCNNKNSQKYYRYGGRGIECKITEEELKKLWFRDKAYLMKKPSIDRIDNDGHYEYKNCRFIEFYDNTIKMTELYKTPIVQFDLDGNFIMEWQSQRKAGMSIAKKDAYKGINKCLKGICKTAHGFIWKYKENYDE